MALASKASGVLAPGARFGGCRKGVASWTEWARGIPDRSQEGPDGTLGRVGLLR